MERTFASEDETPTPWFIRQLFAIEKWARPAWGWGVLIACALLAMLPAVALRANRWLSLGAYQATLELIGPLAVLLVWWLWGWRRQTRSSFGSAALVVTVAIGLLLISQLLIGWLPGPRVWWNALVNNQWMSLLSGMTGAWNEAFARFALWRDGVVSGGAAQDNLVFAAFGSLLFWGVGVVTAWLARGMRQGFAAAAPSLWLLAVILLYSNSGRYLLVLGLILMLVLHGLLEQGALAARWQAKRLDYSPGLLVDRMVAVLGGGAIILTVASVMPNLYISPLVNRYYSALAPVHLVMEQVSERLFPDLQATARWRGAGGAGMPNEFLLRGGPDLGNAVVMRVRTDEAPIFSLEQVPYDELMMAPPGRYMRGRTLTTYDGRGWSNPERLGTAEFAANQRWGEEVGWGRKPVVQSVIMEMGSTMLYAAPEVVEISADVRVERRGEDDLVAVLGREASYSAVSLVPAVDESTLRSLPSWTTSAEGVGTNTALLRDDLAIHLALPNTLSERTRELALQLTAGMENNYDKALAIEQYLRQYTYDLEVEEPPADVVDIADYFLFELQRGYCDYYATAFVVLARLVGLPTRFATGFAVGQWDPIEGVFVVREGNAHSWPEVYFPEVGWIAFEPTGGIAPLSRVALPTQTESVFVPPPIVPADEQEGDAPTVWNWQPLVWLLPIALLIWLLVRGVGWWLQRREDPWQAVLLWGKRVGRPIGEGETVREYGDGLAHFVLQQQGGAADSGRVVAREIVAVSEEVNRIHYGHEDERMAARGALENHWRRLRGYLRLVRIR